VTTDDLEARVGLLAGLALFANTPPQVIEDLARAVVVMQVPSATDVVTEGAAADALWILAEGEVRVSAGDAEIRTVSAPAYFGEVGTLHGIPRIATVSTTQPSTLWRIAGQEFLGVIGPGGGSSR
jgi:CRP-like cAMP-binding protein